MQCPNSDGQHICYKQCYLNSYIDKIAVCGLSAFQWNLKGIVFTITFHKIKKGYNKKM